jgi:VWFA-related protein
MPSVRIVRRMLAAGILLGAVAGAPDCAAQTSGADQSSGARPVAAPGIQEERVSLILLDVVVTDASGRPLNDLRREEFMLTVDGHPVRIQSVDLQIPAPPAGVAAAPEAGTPPPGKALTPPASDLAQPIPRPRGIVLFFDGLDSERGLGPEPIAAARRFLEEGLQPGEEVMLIGLGQNCRIYRDFTADLSLALAALNEIEKDPGLRMAGQDRFWKNIEALKELRRFSRVQAESLAKSFVAEDLGRASRLHSTLEALAGFLRSRPGRKEVFLFSDGVPSAPGILYGIFDSRNQDSDLLRVAREAASSQIALNTINTRGLPGGPPGGLEERLENESTNALSILALATGGVSTHGINSKLESPMRRIEEETRSSYLLTYLPSGEPDGKLHPARVTVSRKGARVRAPEGFVWMTSRQRHEKETVSAYFAPELFRRIPLAMEAGSYLDEDENARVEFAIALPRSAILFLPRAGGRVAKLEAGIVVRSARGKEEEPISRLVEVRLPGGAFKNPEGDLTLLMRRALPAGDYEATAVVRDLESGEVGALRSALRVPALAPDHLAMSSLILSSLATPKPIAIDPAEGGRDVPLVPRSVRRVFSSGEKVAASSLVYHPRRDALTGQARITAFAQIRRGQQVVRHLAPARRTLESRSAVTTLTLLLPVDLSGLESGVYRLEVEAWDEVDRRGVLQEVDFQVR